jgi:hypothetical protein
VPEVKLLARRGKETSGPSGWIASLHAGRSIAEGEGPTIDGDGDLRLTPEADIPIAPTIFD